MTHQWPRVRRQHDARRVLVALKALRFAPTSLREAAGLNVDCARASLAIVVERRNRSTLEPLPLRSRPFGLLADCL
jgi:hypothetical protein